MFWGYFIVQVGKLCEMQIFMVVVRNWLEVFCGSQNRTGFSGCETTICSSLRYLCVVFFDGIQMESVFTERYI